MIRCSWSDGYDYLNSSARDYAEMKGQVSIEKLNLHLLKN